MKGEESGHCAWSKKSVRSQSVPPAVPTLLPQSTPWTSSTHLAGSGVRARAEDAEHGTRVRGDGW